MPEFILVIGLINNEKYTEVLDIIKEYIKGIPHVELPSCTCTSDIKDIYYIVQDNQAIGAFLHKATRIRDIRNKALQSTIYKHECDNYYEARHLFNHYMPIHIKLEHDSLRDLLNLIED